MSKNALSILLGFVALSTVQSTFATEYIDTDTQRSNMHACQIGSYLTGVHIGRNRFACTPDFENYGYGDEWTDQSTVRLGMHTCPDGAAMTGLHNGRNQLLCANFPVLLVNEEIDTNTRRNGMHSCPEGAIMIGIHVSKNLLLCAWPN